MVSFYEVRCVYGVGWFPRVVAFRVAEPFDKVLEGSGASMMSVASYLFHFVLLFSVDKVRWWSGEVRSVGGCFMIGR